MDGTDTVRIECTFRVHTLYPRRTFSKSLLPSCGGGVQTNQGVALWVGTKRGRVAYSKVIAYSLQLNLANATKRARARCLQRRVAQGFDSPISH